MAGYDKSLYEDVAQVQHTGLRSFGSGRLIGTNLVVTSRHVVRPAHADPIDADWMVGLTRENQAGAKECQWYDAKVVWVGRSELDLALIKITTADQLRPRFRTRIARLSGTTDEDIQGHGYPGGAAVGGAKNLTTPPGSLFDQGRFELTFGIDATFQPVAPAEDWAGFSGAAIIHSRVCDARDLWIYGVAQQVPAKFVRQLDVAPLAAATSDPDFCKLLTDAEVTRIAPADPTHIPAAEDFPDIKRLDEYASERLQRPGIALMATKASLCQTIAEMDEIHRGHSDGKLGLSPEDLLAKFKNGDAVNLKTPGGFGKTFYLLQLVRASIEAGYVPFYLDLKGTSETSDPSAEACARLFGAASQKGASWQSLLKARDAGFPVLVAVDSLNEASTVPQIEKLLQFLVRTFGDRLLLIIADRLSEEVPKVPGQLATILPLSADEVEKRLATLNPAQASASFRKLLSIPFFLALYEAVAHRTPQPAANFKSRPDILYGYFAICHDSQVDSGRMKGAGREIVRKLAPVAFVGYRDYGIVMPQAWFEAQLKTQGLSVDALRAAGMLIKDSSEGILFSHQLFHDFLVGYHLADPDDEFAGALRWNSGSFDTASLKGRSFDALEFAVELAQRADELIIEIYDWSYRAAFHLVLKSERDLPGALPVNWGALRDALIILNSEKQFDPFQHTRRAANERAAAIGREVSTKFNRQDFQSLKDLMELAETEYAHPGLYSIWKQIFLLEGKPTSSQWALLQHVPLVAWTAANAFRRSVSDRDELMGYLLALYDALLTRQEIVPSAIGTRWRIVHIFGACNRDDIVEKLCQIVMRETAEPAQWIQYGAVRSLVEIASRRPDENACKAILDRLLGMMGKQITPRSRAFGELRETAILVERRSWWPSAYCSILEKGESLASTPEEAEAWAKRKKDLKGL